MRILVVEDEKDLNRVIVRRLTAEGYSADGCFNGVDALDYLDSAKYDAVVLDVMMPKMNGHEVVRRMRAKGDGTPVLFLTALDAVSDRVEGLDLGADDYLVKPFAFEELMARLRVMTRKAVGVTSAAYTIADLTVDGSTHRVTRGGRSIELTAKEFAILEYLIRNKGVVLSREKIETNVWSFSEETGSNVIEVYIRYLRKKIDEGFDSKLIHTVRGVGYVLRQEI